MKEKYLIALMLIVLTINCCASSYIKTYNVYNRPTGPLSVKEFLKAIRPIQKYEWDDEKEDEIPVGEEKILNDDEVHSLLTVVRRDTEFSFGYSPGDLLNLAEYSKYSPYAHCTASKFNEYAKLCKATKDYKALANYCHEATKKQFQHCSAEGIKNFFNDRLESEKRLNLWGTPFAALDEFDEYMSSKKKYQHLSETDKMEHFMSSLGKKLSGAYKDRCAKLTEGIKEDLAFFFGDENVRKFHYKAINKLEAEYERVWKLCDTINRLEAKSTGSEAS